MKTILIFNISGIGSDTGVNTYCKQLESYICQNPPKKLRFYFVNLNANDKHGFNIVKTKFINYINIPSPIIARQNYNSIFQPAFGRTVADLLKAYIKLDSNIIIHLNWIDLGMMAGVLKSELGCDLNCKIILTRHCIPSRTLLHTNYKDFLTVRHNSFNGQLSYILGKELRHYYSIDKFIAVTECSKKDLIEKFAICEEKISIIKNGVAETSIELNSLGKAFLRSKYNLSIGEKIIVYVGRDEKNIGLRWLLDAFKAILIENQNVRLIIVGKINIAEIAKDNSEIMAKITIMGFVEQIKLFEIFQLCDLGIIPSAYEQCSYTAIEMMKCGLPILVSKVDGLAEMIENGVNGLTFNIHFKSSGISHDSSELKEKIKYALDNGNAEEIKKMVDFAKRQIIAIYSNVKMGNKLLEVYNAV